MIKVGRWNAVNCAVCTGAHETPYTPWPKFKTINSQNLFGIVSVLKFIIKREEEEISRYQRPLPLLSANRWKTDKHYFMHRKIAAICLAHGLTPTAHLSSYFRTLNQLISVILPHWKCRNDEHWSILHTLVLVLYDYYACTIYSEQWALICICSSWLHTHCFTNHPSKWLIRIVLLFRFGARKILSQTLLANLCWSGDFFRGDVSSLSKMRKANPFTLPTNILLRTLHESCLWLCLFDLCHFIFELVASRKVCLVIEQQTVSVTESVFSTFCNAFEKKKFSWKKKNARQKSDKFIVFDLSSTLLLFSVHMEKIIYSSNSHRLTFTRNSIQL